MSPAGMAAVSCVVLTNVVARAEPFHWIVELMEKAVPVTVSVKALAPAPTAEGDRELTVGTGLQSVTVATVAVPCVFEMKARVVLPGCTGPITAFATTATVDPIAGMLPEDPPGMPIVNG